MFQEMLWARRDLVELNYTASSERMYRATFIGQTVIHLCETTTMSRLVGTNWLQYVYVLLVIVNASQPLGFTLLRNAQLVLWHSHRISSLLISIILDVFDVLVVPAILIHAYAFDYDVSVDNFAKKRWFCDRWLMEMLLEMQFLLAVNTISSVVRLLMGLHLLCSLKALKSLLESVTSNRPPIPSTERSVSGSPTKSPFQLIRVKPGARRVVIMEVVLVLIGIVLLTGHLDAQSKILDSKICPLPLRPLFSIDPIYPLLVLNCATNSDLSGGGNGADLERALSGLHHESVRHLVIRACPGVQITHTLYRFPRLLDIKIRDSTLVSWSTDAAVTQDSHPTLYRFGLVNVSVTELPPGLLSDKFPPTLLEIDLCGTNLSTLPTNLHERWSRVEALALELSNVNSVPETVLHMSSLHSLSLRGNNISTIPIELLTKSGLAELSLSRNPIEKLPSNVETTTLKLLAMDSTKMHSVPSWATAKADLYLVMGATPFCDHFDPATADVSAQRVDCTQQPDDVLFPVFTTE